MFKRITIILACIVVVSLLSYMNATRININQLQLRQEILRSEKIDEDLDGLLIAYFSDLYYGEYLDTVYLDKLFNKIKDFNPDLILFGGDLLSFSYDKLNQEEKDYLVNNLKGLNAKYGKYAALGEFDIKQLDTIYSIYSLSDFTILNNTNRMIGVDKNSFINIIGIDSLVDGSPNPSEAFLGANSDYYSIVLSHCPDIFDDLQAYNYEYLLSGHSRGGQINIPIINLFTRQLGYEKYLSGKITKNNKTLDISNGIGRMNVNARLNADSELVLYVLRTKTDTSSSE